MEQRKQFVVEARRARIPFASLCELFGVSRKSGYKWLKRAEEDGLRRLTERSRRPKSNSLAVPDDVVARLVELRESHPYWGARKLIAWLDDHEPWVLVPAASTVTAILKRHGLVARRQGRRRCIPCKSPVAEATSPNIVWSGDFKGDFKVQDGVRCYPLTVMDAFSRMNLCCRAQTTTTLPTTKDRLERTFREWGLPDRFRSDNGHPFAPKRLGPLSRLSVWLVKLGVRPEYTRPGRPQDNGRHERFHRTLKQATCYPPAASLAAQQRRFDRFRREYNYDRPHEALGQRPPASVHQASSRPFPRLVSDPTYPGHHELQRVNGEGFVRWKGTSHFLAETLAGEVVGLVEVDVGAWGVYFGPLLVGRLHVALPELGLVRPDRLLPMSPV